MATLLLQNHLQNSKKKKKKTKTKKNKGSSSPSWEVDEYEWDQVHCVGRMKHEMDSFSSGGEEEWGIPEEEEEEKKLSSSSSAFGRADEKQREKQRLDDDDEEKLSLFDLNTTKNNPLFVGVSRGAREKEADERRFLIGQQQKGKNITVVASNEDGKRETRRNNNNIKNRNGGGSSANGSAKVSSSSVANIKDKLVRCRVDKCEMMCERVYGKRSKVCEMHLKMDEVFHEGMLQRFCQKCTRFHSIEEFKDKRRACALSLSKLAKVRAPNGVNGVGSSMMAAMAKRSGLNADRSEMTSFNRNDEGYQQHVPLDALIAQAKSNPTTTKLSQRQDQLEQGEQQQRNSNTSNSKSTSLIRKEPSDDSNTYGNNDNTKHHKYQRQEQNHHEQHQQQGQQKGQSTMRGFDVLDFAFPGMEEHDDAYFNDFDSAGEPIRPQGNVLGLFSYDFTTGTLQNRSRTNLRKDAEGESTGGDLNIVQEGARKHLEEIGSDTYSGDVDDFFERQQQQQKLYADKMTNFPDAHVSRAEIKISNRTPADISPAVGNGIRQIFKDAAHIRVCAEPGCTKLTVDAVFPDIVRPKNGGSSVEINARELAQKVVDADRTLDDVDASVTFRNQTATRKNGKWTVSDEKNTKMISFGRSLEAPWNAPFVICTNPSRNKKKNTINNHKKGHQQHENKGNLFRISNIAENVVAHVRINGQILKDVKSLRRVESDSSVLCFSVPQDYAEGVLSVDLVWSDEDSTHPDLVGKPAYDRFTTILTPDEKVADEIQSFITEVHSLSPRVARSLRTHLETIFAEDFRSESFERPMFREMVKDITSWSLRNSFSYTAERLFEAQKRALEEFQLSRKAHTALATTCKTYLHSASLSGSSNLVKMVIIHGGDSDIFGSATTMVTLPNGSKECALHVASSDVFAHSSPLVLELFLLGEENVRAFFTLKNSKGETSRDISSGHELRGSLQHVYVQRCVQSALNVFWNVSKAIVDQYLTSIAMKHRLFTQDALSCWTDAYEEVCGNSSGIIDDMKTNFVKDIAKSSKSTDFAFITTAPVADTDEGDIDVLLEENNEGVRLSLELAMVLSSCDHVVREVCDRHFSHIRRERMNALNRPTARANKEEEENNEKKEVRGSSEFQSREDGSPPRCADSFLNDCFLPRRRKSRIRMKLSTCAIHIETAARARITQVQNAWHRLADYVAGLAILSFDEPEMEKLYVHEDSTEKISTDLFVHLFYSLAIFIAYVRFYRANQLFGIIFSPYTCTQLFKKFVAICTLPALCYMNYFNPKFYVRHREAINVVSRILLSFLPSGNKQLENVIMPVLIVLKVVMFRMSSALWPIRAERHACMVILGEILNPTCVSSILSVYAIIPMILNIYFCFIIELRQRRMFACKYGCIWLNQRWSVYGSKSGKWTHSKRRGASKVYTTKRASTNTTTTITTPTTSNYAR